MLSLELGFAIVIPAFGVGLPPYLRCLGACVVRSSIDGFVNTVVLPLGRMFLVGSAPVIFVGCGGIARSLSFALYLPRLFCWVMWLAVSANSPVWVS